MREKVSSIEIIVLFLIFLSFYFYQEMFSVLGYRVFRDTASVTYVYRGIIVLMIFFTPLLIIAPPPRKYLALLVFILGTISVIYWTWKVSGRPWVDQICDRDEALDIALGRLFRGKFPYGEATSLGGQVTAMGGSFLLALPGWLLAGRSELSSILWIPLGGAMLWDAARLRQRYEWIIPLLAMYFWGPPMVLNLVNGSDLPWLSISLAAGWWMLARGWIMPAALVLSLWLTQRTLGLVLLPITLTWFWRQHRRDFLMLLGTMLLPAAGLTLPFMLWNPSVYFRIAPLGVSVQKYDLAPTPGDNPVTDILNLVMPDGTAHMIVAATVLLVAIGVLSLAGRLTFSSLMMRSLVILCLALFFMGPYFLSDYLILAYMPAMMASVLSEKITYPIEPASHSMNPSESCEIVN